MKSTKSIEVVRTSVNGLSSMSNESATTITASLAGLYTDVILTIVNTPEDLSALLKRKPDLVFLGVMSIMDHGKEVWMSDALESAGISHTGSRRPSHQLEINKDEAKQQVINHNLATAPFQIVNLGEVYGKHNIGLHFPLFVKPLSCGGGKGVDQYSVTRSMKQLNSKISSLQKEYNVNILIENYLEGREFSVAVIRNQDSDTLIAMPLELIAPKDINGDRMLGSIVKSSNEEQAIAINDPTLKDSISKFALDIFEALGARDYGRIDIRLDDSGIPNFLEANLMPSLIQGYGSFPKAYLLNQGVDYKEMINNIALLGLSRAKIA